MRVLCTDSLTLNAKLKSSRSHTEYTAHTLSLSSSVNARRVVYTRGAYFTPHCQHVGTLHEHTCTPNVNVRVFVLSSFSLKSHRASSSTQPLTLRKLPPPPSCIVRPRPATVRDQEEPFECVMRIIELSFTHLIRLKSGEF